MKYFLIGIKGSGMSSLAHILLDKGYEVEGCDTLDYVYTQDDLLKQIGRIHGVEQFLETYKKARKVGFKNINVDLMLGLPNQRIKDLELTKEEHLTASINS